VRLLRFLSCAQPTLGGESRPKQRHPRTVVMLKFNCCCNGSYETAIYAKRARSFQARRWRSETTCSFCTLNGLKLLQKKAKKQDQIFVSVNLLILDNMFTFVSKQQNGFFSAPCRHSLILTKRPPALDPLHLVAVRANHFSCLCACCVLFSVPEMCSIGELCSGNSNRAVVKPVQAVAPQPRHPRQAEKVRTFPFATVELVSLAQAHECRSGAVVLRCSAVVLNLFWPVDHLFKKYISDGSLCYADTSWTTSLVETLLHFGGVT